MSSDASTRPCSIFDRYDAAHIPRHSPSWLQSRRILSRRIINPTTFLSIPAPSFVYNIASRAALRKDAEFFLKSAKNP